MGNKQSKNHDGSPPPYSPFRDPQLPISQKEGTRDGYTPPSSPPPSRHSSTAPSRSSHININNQQRREGRRPRPDIEMGVRPEEMREIKEAQRKTNETLAELVTLVGKLVHEGQARDKELALAQAELAKEKEERGRWEAKEKEERRRWEAKEREDAEREYRLKAFRELNRGKMD